MFTRLLVSAALAAALSQAALAQNSGNQNRAQPSGASQTDPNNQPSQEENVSNIPQQIRQQLSDAGFKDVKIVPGSFLVSAKDKDGHDVMMRITPQSVTVLTEAPMTTPSTTGQGQGQSGAPNSSDDHK